MDISSPLPISYNPLRAGLEVDLLGGAVAGAVVLARALAVGVGILGGLPGVDPRLDAEGKVLVNNRDNRKGGVWFKRNVREQMREGSGRTRCC